jgi:hypothetical protein
MKLQALSGGKFLNISRGPGEERLYDASKAEDLATIRQYYKEYPADFGLLDQHARSLVNPTVSSSLPGPSAAVATQNPRKRSLSIGVPEKEEKDEKEEDGAVSGEKEASDDKPNKKSKTRKDILFVEDHARNHLFHIKERDPHSTFLNKDVYNKAKNAIRLSLRERPPKSNGSRDILMQEVIGFKSGSRGIAEKYPTTKTVRCYFKVNTNGTFTVKSCHPCEPFDQPSFRGNIPEMVFNGDRTQSKRTVNLA